MLSVSEDLLQAVGERKFATVLADPPWQFTNRTGKMAPEHKRLCRYPKARRCAWSWNPSLPQLIFYR